jgi:hypothetical protein
MTVDQKRLCEFAEGAYGVAQLPYQVAKASVEDGLSFGVGSERRSAPQLVELSDERGVKL